MTALHTESLLRVPLVRRMVEDDSVRKVARQVDCRWRYERYVPVTVTGFNPFESAVYFGAESAFARWLPRADGSARDYNEGDFLVHEVLFAVHDYLHVWSSRLVAELASERQFGTAALTPDTLEDLAFMHLVTEAVATVGLDYWYLATVNLNEIAPIGTTYTRLTVDYRESDADEYRRANPAFCVQTPDFFVELATFYATGELRGFDVEDVRRSALAFRWLSHELSYGALQRAYTRRWLRYLGTGDIQRVDRRDRRPLTVDQPWQTALLRDVAHHLWRFVKEGIDSRPGPLRCTWRSPLRDVPDFRFVNLNCAATDDLRGITREVSASENRDYLYYQLLSRYDYATFDPALKDILRDVARTTSPATLQQLFARCAEVPAPPDTEPRDLLILN